MQLFSADAKIFLKKILKFFCPLKHEKTSPQKLFIIPLDHQISVQKFLLWETETVLKYERVWNFLIFEIVKLCRMKK